MLNGNELGNEIINEMSKSDVLDRDSMFRAIGRGIVNYLKEHAEVHTTVRVDVSGDMDDEGRIFAAGDGQGDGKIL